jgi:U3 small nucleolar RNA-associated protein 21
VGRCLQTYDLRKGLNLVFLTRPQTEGDVTAIASWRDRVFAAWSGNGKIGVSVFKRGKRIDELEATDDLDEPIHQVLIFGSWIVGCCSTKIVVWKSAGYEYYTILMPPHPGRRDANKILSGICNMPTFLNKIFVGRDDGSVEIWNVSTGSVLFILSFYAHCHRCNLTSIGNSFTQYSPLQATAVVSLLFSQPLRSLSLLSPMQAVS